MEAAGRRRVISGSPRSHRFWNPRVGRYSTSRSPDAKRKYTTAPTNPTAAVRKNGALKLPVRSISQPVTATPMMPGIVPAVFARPQMTSACRGAMSKLFTANPERQSASVPDAPHMRNIAIVGDVADESTHPLAVCVHPNCACIEMHATEMLVRSMYEMSTAAPHNNTTLYHAGQRRAATAAGAGGAGVIIDGAGGGGREAGPEPTSRGGPRPPHPNVANRLPLLYTRSPRSNTHAATTAYAVTAVPIATAVHAAGARINSTGRYPTNPAGITVNRIQRIGPVKSVSGYNENMSVTSYNCRLADSVRPSQKAALCINTAV